MTTKFSSPVTVIQHMMMYVHVKLQRFDTRHEKAKRYYAQTSGTWHPERIWASVCTTIPATHRTAIVPRKRTA